MSGPTGNNSARTTSFRMPGFHLGSCSKGPHSDRDARKRVRPKCHKRFGTVMRIYCLRNSSGSRMTACFNVVRTTYPCPGGRRRYRRPSRRHSARSWRFFRFGTRLCDSAPSARISTTLGPISRGSAGYVPFTLAVKESKLPLLHS
jgi:hypothetical protein